MALQPGSRLGPYEVLAAIGAGGMGEVYKARDTKLDRDVALKILPDAFTNDAERLARFQREAKVLASLNHPNIAQIHGLEDSGETHALVLELVEGQTLADRINQGPIPVDEALPIAKQITEALEAAHEQGIIHRDLKPANIKLRLDGTVKVLDFGLAKALEGEHADADHAQSPTLSMTAAATRAGLILGTAAYMSPEQAKGRAVDRRSDIWAFGAVLYEMLTGAQTFGADDPSSAIARVIEREPDWTRLPPDTPHSVRRLMRRCLEKAPSKRLRHIGDAGLELDESDDLAAWDTPGAGSSRSGLRPIPLLVLGDLLLVIGGLVGRSLVDGPPPQAQPSVRFSVSPPSTDLIAQLNRPIVALSPDGANVAMAALGGFYVRSMDDTTPRLLPGTSEASNVFFSPNSQWIGFTQEQQLKKIAIDGSRPVSLGDIPDILGASWGPGDTILFGSSDGVMGMPGAGGVPERLFGFDVAWSIATRPPMLPGGQSVLFTAVTGGAVSSRIVVHSLQVGESRVLIERAADARYLPSGHLVYGQDGRLFAVPFDPDDQQLVGTPVQVLDSDVMSSIGMMQFDVAAAGALAYVSGEGQATARTLVWVDTEGREEALPLDPDRYLHPALSPDGRRIAFEIERGGSADVWTYDLERGSLSQLTSHPALDERTRWTPDGRGVVFSSNREGNQFNLYWKAADGTGEVERLTSSENQQAPYAWSADGARLAMTDGRGISLLSMSEPHDVEPLLALQDIARGYPMISPDGRWMAYKSVESGSESVYVRPFPDVQSGRWSVSIGSGDDPLWAPDGRTTYYRGGAGQMMAVSFDPDPSPSLSTPRSLFLGPHLESPGVQADVHPDGDRFVMVKIAGQDPEKPNLTAGPTQVHVVLNWDEELQARVPTGR